MQNARLGVMFGQCFLFLMFKQIERRIKKSIATRISIKASEVVVKHELF